MIIHIPKSDLAFTILLKNFATKIGKYGTGLGITEREITSLQKDAAAFDYVVNCQSVIQIFAQSFTTFKNVLRKGGEVELMAMPVAPVLDNPPPMPAPHIDGRLRNVIQRIVSHPDYTSTIGEDLGIEGGMEALAAIEAKPRFFIKLASNGHPNIRWIKGKFHGVEIWKDTGRGFMKLERDFKPRFFDKSPLPPWGVTAVWKYKMIYLLKDQPIGSWSDVVSVTVRG
jgi:hypothetical protein